MVRLLPACPLDSPMDGQSDRQLDEGQLCRLVEVQLAKKRARTNYIGTSLSE